MLRLTRLERWSSCRCVSDRNLAIICAYEEFVRSKHANDHRSIRRFCCFLVSLHAISLVEAREVQDSLPCGVHMVRCRNASMVGCSNSHSSIIANEARMIWALAVARGVGPLWSSGQNVPAASPFGTSWLIMAGINQSIGGLAAGITNGSDFSRYASARRHYIYGTIGSCVITGVLVSLVGLVTAAAAQKIYGEVYWNPPDLLMRMMDNGNGSSKARAGVFFLAAGFAFTAMFENICGNAIAGGIDLAGMFPRYIDIRRGAIITFVAAWIVQPWQLINRATTFIAVLSSFSVFLAPIIGIMACDFYLLRRRRVQLSHLYKTRGSSYYFWKGLNWRAVPAWIFGWAPTIGGLVVTVRGDPNPPKPLVQLYYMAFLIGMSSS